jgi:DNA-binding NtrC family response regulator
MVVSPNGTAYFTAEAFGAKQQMPGCPSQSFGYGTALSRVSVSVETVGSVYQLVRVNVVLLTDVVMRGINGPALAHSLSFIHPETKGLYTSGYGGKFGAQNGILAAGDSFLQKPFSRAKLLRKLRELLDLRHGPGPSPLSGPTFLGN